MPTGSTAKLSPIKWFFGVVLFVIVTVGCAALGIWLSGGPRDTAPAGAPTPVLAVVLIVFGVVIAAIGMAAYALVLLTNAFTFDFSRPFFKTFGGKLWVANLVVGLLL